MGRAIPTLSRRAAKAGLKGLEWAVGIPGTIGGAAVMNAGAQGGCIANLLESVQVIPLQGGKSFEIKNQDLKYDYRSSLLQQENLLVISANLRLETGHDKQLITSITTKND